MDGGSEQSYQSRRPGGTLNGVLEGIVSLKEEKKKANALFPRIIVECLVGSQSIDEIAEVKRLALAAGANIVKFKTLRLEDQGDVSAAEKVLPTERRLWRYDIEGNRLKMKRTRDGCRRLGYSAVVAWNGDIYPCCFYLKFFAPFGNIFDEPFKQIWRGELLQQFRKVVAGDREIIPMCRNCTEGLPYLYVNPLKSRKSWHSRILNIIKT